MEIYLTRASSVHRVMLLVDLTTGLQESDSLVLDMLVEQTRPVTLVLTKADKVKPKYVLPQAKSVIEAV